MPHCMECTHFGKYGCADKNRCTGTLDAMAGKVVACGSFEPSAAMPGAILVTLNAEDRFGATLKKFGREISIPPLDKVAKLEWGFDHLNRPIELSICKQKPLFDTGTVEEDFEYWRKFYPEVSKHLDRSNLLAKLIDVLDSSTSNSGVDQLARLKNIVQSYRSKGAI